MTLNIRQVDFSITQRNKGLTQEVSAATTGISVRSGRRIEKGLWRQAGGRSDGYLYFIVHQPYRQPAFHMNKDMHQKPYALMRAKIDEKPFSTR